MIVKFSLNYFQQLKYQIGIVLNQLNGFHVSKYDINPTMTNVQCLVTKPNKSNDRMVEESALPW